MILSSAKLRLRASLLKVNSHLEVQGSEMGDQPANMTRDSERCDISTVTGE